MSGHSQFKNIMYRKGAQDAKRAKVFSKISREITVAVKEGGSDANSNTRLRSALISARAENMPKDNIDRAIKKALGGEGNVNYQSLRYEGYGPGGTALIVEALTDNNKRTGPEVRAAFTKYGGSLGEENSVAFMFDHIGYIFYQSRDNLSEEAMFEAAVEAGADDVNTVEEGYEITCPIAQFAAVRDSLEKTFGEPFAAKITWKPKNFVDVDDQTAETLEKLIDALENNDDVQNVITNAS